MYKPDISNVPSYLNALGAKELLLRDRGITDFQSICSEPRVGDNHDFLDLSSNFISALSYKGPKLARLKGLLLANNRIKAISPDLAEFLPNVEVLVLSNNQLVSRSDLNFLKGMSKLLHIHIDGNPDLINSDTDADFRQFIISLQPCLRFINGQRVTDKERAAASAGNVHNGSSGLSREQLLERLDQAETLEEMKIVEDMLKSMNK